MFYIAHKGSKDNQLYLLPMESIGYSKIKGNIEYHWECQMMKKSKYKNKRVQNNRSSTIRQIKINSTPAKPYSIAESCFDIFSPLFMRPSFMKLMKLRLSMRLLTISPLTLYYHWVGLYFEHPCLGGASDSPSQQVIRKSNMHHFQQENLITCVKTQSFPFGSRAAFAFLTVLPSSVWNALIVSRVGVSPIRG